MSYNIPAGELRQDERKGIIIAVGIVGLIAMFFVYGWGANHGKAVGYQKGVEAGKREIMEAIAKQEPWEYLGVRYFVGDERIYRKKHPEMFRHVPPQLPRLR